MLTIFACGRVLADGHVPWACEAFTKLHGRSLVETPPLIWYTPPEGLLFILWLGFLCLSWQESSQGPIICRCWRLLLIKLWNHCLIDGRTMNNCSTILEGYQKETASSEGSWLNWFFSFLTELMLYKHSEIVYWSTSSLVWSRVLVITLINSYLSILFCTRT